MAVVYALYDSRDPHTYRYVGKTLRDPRLRLSAHRNTGNYNTWVSRWSRKVQREGGAVEMVVLETTNREMLKFAEGMWIAALREAGYPLTNVLPGGEGGRLPGFHHSSVTKAKITAAGTGRPVSEATREKLRTANLGHPVSQLTRDRLSAANKKSRESRNRVANPEST